MLLCANVFGPTYYFFFQPIRMKGVRGVYRMYKLDDQKVATLIQYQPSDRISEAMHSHIPSNRAFTCSTTNHRAIFKIACVLVRATLQCKIETQDQILNVWWQVEVVIMWETTSVESLWKFKIIVKLFQQPSWFACYKSAKYLLQLTRSEFKILEVTHYDFRSFVKTNLRRRFEHRIFSIFTRLYHNDDFNTSLNRHSA